MIRIAASVFVICAFVGAVVAVIGLAMLLGWFVGDLIKAVEELLLWAS